MMLSTTEFEKVYKHITQAHRSEDIYGDLGDGNAQSQINNLQQAFLAQSQNVNPDLYPDNKMKYMAGEAYQTLHDAKTIAEVKIKNGTYGKSLPPHTSILGTNEISFQVGEYTYWVTKEAIAGDFCQVYMAQRKGPKGIEDICLKIPYDSGDNDLMANEAKTYHLVQHKSLPVLLDTFITQNKQVNVLRRIDGGLDLISVKKLVPNGLPQEHVVWVMDRLLSVLGYLHINNILHGSIEPGNIMIVPGNHNGLLIDMLFSIPEANLPGATYHGVNQYTAPEIVSQSHLTPHTSSDMYSLGKSMFYLLGGDPKTNHYPSGVDPRLVSFIDQFLDPDPYRRSGDAWKSWHQLHQLRQEIFGEANQFLPLNLGNIPERN